MRIIGHIDNEASARVFGDYLYVKGIDNEVEPEEGKYAIWIKDEDQLDKAKELLKQFQQNPSNPEYKRVGGSADEKRAEAQKDDLAARKRIIKARRLFPGMRTFTVGPLTFMLFAACVYIAIRSKLGGSFAHSATGMFEALRPISGLFISDIEYPVKTFLAEVRQGEVWRLFTPMLIHFGALHIIGNMSWLLYLGSMIEDRNGTGQFTAMVLVISGGSNVLQLLWSGHPFFGGMSGVAYGLFGYVLVRSKVDIASEYFIDRRDVIFSLVWLFACTTGLVGPIANAAHFGGLFIGMAWGFVDAMISRRNP